MPVGKQGDLMRSFWIAAFATMLAITPALSQAALGQDKGKSAPGSAVAAQASLGTPVAPGISAQGGEPGSTLEISPQPEAPTAGVDVVPNERESEPGPESASLPETFESGDGANGGFESCPVERPYIGVTIRYAMTRYLGKEERGLEIMTVDPNSPAAIAGLHGATGPSPLGAAGVTAGELLPPLTLLTTPLLNRAGALGKGGDIIVAVDDHRVRSEQDFQGSLARMKPGDTAYLTVIRPVSGGYKTLKLAVHLGSTRYANAESDSVPDPSVPNLQW